MLVQTRHRIVQPLVPPRREHGFGGDDVDALETVDAGQQVEVDRPQAAGVGSLIGDRDHQMAIG
jgi:hypothetical protein